MNCKKCDQACFNKSRCVKTRKYNIVLLLDQLLSAIFITCLCFFSLLYFRGKFILLLNSSIFEIWFISESIIVLSVLLGCCYFTRRYLKKDERFYFLGCFVLENKIF